MDRDTEIWKTLFYLGKLKHAFDLWNSNIFLVVAEENVSQARHLLAGTFHERKSFQQLAFSKTDISKKSNLKFKPFTKLRS